MNKLPVLLHVGTWRDGRTARVDTSAEGISEALAKGLAADGKDDSDHRAEGAFTKKRRICIASFLPVLVLVRSSVRSSVRPEL